MVREEECPPEEFGGGGPPPKRPRVPTIEIVPVPGVPPAALGLGALVDLIRDIFGFLRSGSPVYIKAATRSEIKQYTLTNPAAYTRITTIPLDALQWELWNSDLGSATGTLSWAYVLDPGATGTGTFNRLASNDRVARALAGVDIYVRPQNANQVVVIEVLRP